MAIMASGIARGRVRTTTTTTTTTTTESRNMAAILQSIELADRDMYPRILAEECRLFLAGFLKKKNQFNKWLRKLIYKPF